MTVGGHAHLELPRPPRGRPHSEGDSPLGPGRHGLDPARGERAVDPQLHRQRTLRAGVDDLGDHLARLPGDPALAARREADDAGAVARPVPREAQHPDRNRRVDGAQTAERETVPAAAGEVADDTMRRCRPRR
jgi:hypothetical protein